VVEDPGETEIDAPDPAEEPPQLPVYHCHEAPVPSDPPTTVSVVEPPQVGFVVALIEVGAVEFVLTVTVNDAQVVVLQVPEALTKYVVVDEGETEIDDPDPAEVPPQLPVNHSHEAPVPSDPPTTESVVDPPQVGFVVALIDVGAVELVLTVTVKEAQVVVLQVPDALT
jgi:hypothetical protein